MACADLSLEELEEQNNLDEISMFFMTICTFQYFPCSFFFPFFCPDFGRFHGIPFGSTGAVEERAAAVHGQSQGGH